MPTRELFIRAEDIYGIPQEDGSFRNMSPFAVRLEVERRLLRAGFDMTASRNPVERERRDDGILYRQRYYSIERLPGIPNAALGTVGNEPANPMEEFHPPRLTTPPPVDTATLPALALDRGWTYGVASHFALDETRAFGIMSTFSAARYTGRMTTITAESSDGASLIHGSMSFGATITNTPVVSPQTEPIPLIKGKRYYAGVKATKNA